MNFQNHQGAMKVDFDIIIRVNKSNQGDIKSICELIDYYAEVENWQFAIEYLELLVDNHPSFCEAKFKDYTGDSLSYERMLCLIGQVYFEDNDFIPAFRWWQKYLDYLDYLNASNSKEEWLPEKQKLHIYHVLKNANQLDKIHNRFLLKWEQDLFNNSTRTS